MRIKSKLCNYPGCNYPRFSKGFCLKHRKQPPKRYKSINLISRVSRKRVVENREYVRVCEEMDAKYSYDGSTYCFFCLHPTGDVKDHHHVAGRTGGLMLKGIVPCHPKCHRAELGGFHGLSLDKLAKMPYIDSYLLLLEETSTEKYNKLLTKLIDHGYEGAHKR
jgi:hypothetical protein